MNAIRVVKTLGPIDGRNLVRDSMLRWMLLAPLLLALGFRFLLPWAMAGIGARFGVDLHVYLPIVYAYLVVITPVLFGMIVGFLLLDERDDRTLTALQVTPLTLNQYATYRIGVPMLISLAVTPLMLRVVGDTTLTWPAMLLVSLVAAPLAPIFMLFLAAFAPNKVQGLALTKGAGIILFVPIAAWFVATPWQWLLGFAPTYWPAKVYWLLAADAPTTWVFTLLGLGWQILLIGLLFRRFNQVMVR